MMDDRAHGALVLGYCLSCTAQKLANALSHCRSLCREERVTTAGQMKPWCKKYELTEMHTTAESITNFVASKYCYCISAKYHHGLLCPV